MCLFLCINSHTDHEGHKTNIYSVRTKHLTKWNSNTISAVHGNNHSLSKENKDIYAVNAVFCCLSERTPTLGYSKLNPAARGCFYRSIWFSTDSTSQISSFACQHVLISWLSYNTDVLYLSFQGDNSYVTSIEIQSKASGGGGSQQRALVIYEAVSFDNWCSVTAKPWHLTQLGLDRLCFET